ncbi:MAG TPA: SDR family NAD(P)-dependent oxidoreductase, partial [Thermodesulfobacteriota bacterium]|nr:SDR family NAD(P)-dependent oxidoreductase [Thermodesulfobacteriota bacterium]
MKWVMRRGRERGRRFAVDFSGGEGIDFYHQTGKGANILEISLEGKTAIVTGAGKGIGKGMAKGLAAAKATVVVNDVDLPAAEAVAGEIQSSGGK